MEDVVDVEFIDVDGFSDSGKEYLFSGRSLGQRNYHNVLERQRRNNIKNGYLQLRDVVPNLVDKKVARIHILRKAIEYIRFLKEDITKKEQQLLDLKVLSPNTN
ncbi:hypothetical protein JTE90_024038 [Oedothorax gibbosus]|uniref:BHLH domain-containing protein n=1 Tax=Oedothorax gibbosus TaxID=931172 RepID=A0AAV6VAI3_9ARAC|nr:hypothetical protein JTE90_024038 [Oedothorax gibbosus]